MGFLIKDFKMITQELVAIIWGIIALFQFSYLIRDPCSVFSPNNN